jgi:surface protein
MAKFEDIKGTTEGSFKVGGSAGEGKVLTSDANGVGTWKTPISRATIVENEAERLALSSAYGDMVLQMDDGRLYIKTQQFVSTWKTDNIVAGSSNSDQIRLPLDSTGTYDFHVHWGDGTTSDVTSYNQAEVTHTYAAGAGTYTVRITGTINGWTFSYSCPNYGDHLKITNIAAWGQLKVKPGYGNPSNQFANCSNMTCTATDIMDLSDVTYADFMFAGCTKFNGDLSLCDTSKITNMYSMFNGAQAFNSDISGWDTGAVTNMGYMLAGTIYGTTAFNQNLSTWNTSKVTSMIGMFANATAFNGDISGWDTSKVTDMSGMFYSAIVFNQDLPWDTSSVVGTGFNTMFWGATAFNGDVSSFDVSGVTSLYYMFCLASSFNQDISGWAVGTNITSEFGLAGMFYHATSFNHDLSTWDVSTVKSMATMFAGVTLSTANYDALLIGWEPHVVIDDVTLDAGLSKYTAGGAAAAARAHLVAATPGGHGWTITDGGTA